MQLIIIIINSSSRSIVMIYIILPVKTSSVSVSTYKFWLRKHSNVKVLWLYCTVKSIASMVIF